MNDTPAHRPTRSSRPVWLGEDRRRWDHVRIHIDLICDPRFDAYDVAVYAGLVVHAEVATGDAEPSQETLARYLGCSDRAVRRSLTRLRETGWVEWEMRAGKASRYRLMPPPTPDSQTGVPRTDVPTTPDSQSDHPGLRRTATPDSQSDKQERDKQELQNGAGGWPSGPPTPEQGPAVEAWAFPRECLTQARGVLRGEG